MSVLANEANAMSFVTRWLVRFSGESRLKFERLGSWPERSTRAVSHRACRKYPSLANHWNFRFHPLIGAVVHWSGSRPVGEPKSGIDRKGLRPGKKVLAD